MIQSLQLVNVGWNYWEIEQDQYSIEIEIIPVIMGVRGKKEKCRLKQVYTVSNMESTNLNTRDSSISNTLVRIIH
jgi:hypothetical protein